jgi:peptidoglycan/LPS O-acetylase OafA/YrhL
LIALLLLGFGVLAMFSIGFPFFILGAAMLVLWPLRERRRLFTSLLVGVLAFIVVGVLVAPLGCTATATSREGAVAIEGRTICDNLLGIRYEGFTGYDAPMWPAVAAGFAAGGLAAGITYLLLSPRARRRGPTEAATSPPNSSP